MSKALIFMYGCRRKRPTAFTILMYVDEGVTSLPRLPEPLLGDGAPPLNRADTSSLVPASGAVRRTRSTVSTAPGSNQTSANICVIY